MTTTPTTFTLTEQHIKLVRAMYVEMLDSSYGKSPAVNCKRPYGNSFIPGDVAEILGIDLVEDGSGDFDQSTIDGLMAIHNETGLALQIILCTGSFEPGAYVRPELYDTSLWVKV